MAQARGTSSSLPPVGLRARCGMEPPSHRGLTEGARRDAVVTSAMDSSGTESDLL
jgi:hypothetical protein